MKKKKGKAIGTPFGVVTLLVMMLTTIINVTIIFYVSQHQIDNSYISSLKDEMLSFMQTTTKLEQVEEATKNVSAPILVEVIDPQERTLVYTNSEARNKSLLKGSWGISEYFDRVLKGKSYTILEQDNENFNSMSQIGFNLPSSIIGLSKMSDNYYMIIQTEVIASLYAANAANSVLITTVGLMLVISTVIALIVSRKYSKSNKIIIRTAEDIANRKEVKFKPFAIKELNMLANSLNHVSKEMKSYDQSQKTFISDASHELKTPLSVISSYTEAIKVGLVETEEEKTEFCDIILDECDRMNTMIVDMISLVKAGMIGGEPMKSPVDIGEYVKAEMVRYKEKFSSAGLNYGINVTEKDMLISVDTDDLEKIMSNFISNAYKYCSKNGNIIVSCKREKTYIVVSVYNDCEPISDEDLARLWDRFYKGDQSRTRNESSTGIGLSIVKAIIEKNEYPYGVSNVKSGIEFWVAFPSFEED